MLIIVIMLFLCAIHRADSAEIWYETKDSETQPLIDKSKQSEFSFVKRIALLPSDIQRNILSKLFSGSKEDDEQNSAKLTSLDPGLGLKLFFRSQKKCPLTIGNKTFDWQDLIRLTKQQQKDLFSIGNPGCCYSCITGYDNNRFGVGTSVSNCSNYWPMRVDILEKQPEHIKKS